MKYCIAILIYFFLTTQNATAFCVATRDYTPLNQRYDKGLLFAARDCNHNNAKNHFIFGTYHSDKRAILQTAHMAFASLSYVKSAVFEIKSDAQIQTKMLAAITFPAASPDLKDLIGSALYNKLVNASKIYGNIPAPLLPRLRIWAAAILLQYPRSESDGIVLDAALEKHAQTLGVQTNGLETIDEQFSIFQQLTKQQQLYFLQHTLDNLDTLNEMLEKLTAYYIMQDLKHIEALSYEAFNALPDKKLALYLQDALITKRNIRMAERLIPLFNAQSTFVGVGALHLPGNMGILHLLEQKGFQIQPIPITQ